MKTLKLFVFSLLLVFVMPKCASSQPQTPWGHDEKTYFYGVEISEILCGYVKITSAPEMKEDRQVLRQEAIVSLNLSVLGGGVNLLITNQYLTDPETEQFFFNQTDIKQGSVSMDFSSVLQEDTILFTSGSGQIHKRIPVTPGLILEGPLTTIHIVNDFIKGDLQKKSYEVYDPSRGEIAEKSYTRLGTDDLELAGKSYSCIMLNEENPSLGVTAKQWYDTETGLNIQTVIANRRIYLADPSVVKNITTANLDEMLFARVGTKIPDIHNIEYMKVRGIIKSSGEKITPESLHAGGQSFSGSVNDNLIEGVFELTPGKYKGENAPPFPTDFSNNQELKKYLAPENLIESSDPVLVEKAREITEGSADAWDAAKRLSKWVAENIEGAVPGGTSAINTYKTRQGECGSHSRLLAAFCRAAGIPARVVAGCMYTTLYGGSFGQHAWTEIWMGRDAGWIPVDATAFETDFIDAGHIRLGEKSTFNPEEMEILEYRMAGGETEQIGDTIPFAFRPYVGKYTDLERNRIFTVTFQNNGLAVDIPGQMVLALNDPDTAERWYPQITRQLYFKFPKTTVGTVEKMYVTQVVPIPKSETPDSMLLDAPAHLAPMIGLYSLPQANLTVAVSARGNALRIPDITGPKGKKVILTESGKSWMSDDGKYEVQFEKNDQGEVSRMIISISFTFKKGEPAASVLEKVIDEEGIEEGIRRYQEMHAVNQGEYIFSEELMNALGYRLIAQNKIAEAIEVFKLNVSDHPDSFNTYDSLGEAYMRKGDNELAVLNYKKSLELNPDNENGKKILEKIQSGENPD